MDINRICGVYPGSSTDIRVLDKGLEKNPNHHRLWSCKGGLLISQGRYTEAIGCYERALGILENIELDSSDKNHRGDLTAALNSMALCYEGLGSSEKAEEIRDRIAELFEG